MVLSDRMTSQVYTSDRISDMRSFCRSIDGPFRLNDTKFMKVIELPKGVNKPNGNRDGFN